MFMFVIISRLDPASDCACRVQDIGLYGVLKKHVVTLLLMSVFQQSI